MPTVNTSDNRYGVAQLIVAPTLAEGANYTTIASALTAASSGQTIFIRPGTYTENLTLKAGVNLTAFGCDSSINQTGVVIINGNCTLSTAGTVTISGIQLQTNSANCLTVSGSVASVVNLNNCNINASNNTGISFSSSSASSAINLYYCTGNLGTTGIALFSHSSAGAMVFSFSYIQNSGSSTTASTTSGSGSLQLYNSLFNIVFSTSSTSTFTSSTCSFNTVAINTTVLTIAGTGANALYGGLIQSGTASVISISVGASLVLSSSTITSNNTNAITGAGTIFYQGLSFTGSSSTINTTTQTASGTLQGSKNTAPSAGFLGERIEGTVAVGAVVLANSTAKNVVSINLTAGIWDISTICVISGSLQTRILTGPSNISNTLFANIGIDTSDTPTSSTAGANVTNVVPALRAIVTTTTTWFLVAQVAFTGSANAGGRISATRVG